MVLFSLLLLVLWMFDHAFIVQELLQYFERQVTHMTKTNKVTQLKYLTYSYLSTPPLPVHAGSPYQFMLDPPTSSCWIHPCICLHNYIHSCGCLSFMILLISASESVWGRGPQPIIFMLSETVVKGSKIRGVTI